MANIEINYEELKKNYAYVVDKINELLTLVENLNNDCKSLCSSECWQGVLSTFFENVKGTMYESEVQNILNFKSTEEYKNVIMKAFKETEDNSSKNYNI